jgi:hypothetical protein
MTTEPGHMPEQHAQHQQWTPGRLMNWAQSIGPEVLVWARLSHKNLTCLSIDSRVETESVKLSMAA